MNLDPAVILPHSNLVSLGNIKRSADAQQVASRSYHCPFGNMCVCVVQRVLKAMCCQWC